jgi:hypothetical protein
MKVYLNQHFRRMLKNVLRVSLLAFLSSAVSPPNACAQFTEGAKLLTPGARANAMGGAFVAVDDDATAAVINPAGVQLLSKPQFYVEFTGTAGEPLKDYSTLPTNRASFFSLALPVSDRVSVAITHNEPYFVSFKNPVVQLSGESYSASLAVLAGGGLRLGATLSHDDTECDGNSQFCSTLVSHTHGASVTTGALWQHNQVSIGISGVVGSEGSPLWDRFSIGMAVRPSSRLLATVDLDTIQFGRGSSVYLTEPHLGAEYLITSGPVSWFVRGGGFTSFGSDAVTDRGLTVGSGIAVASHLQIDAAYVTQRNRVVFSSAVRF